MRARPQAFRLREPDLPAAERAVSSLLLHEDAMISRPSSLICRRVLLIHRTCCWLLQDVVDLQGATQTWWDGQTVRGHLAFAGQQHSG
jgi:hypothetical protein